MLIVYSLLNGHPASTLCEQFIRERTGWFTTGLTLLEARAVLVKVYAVDPGLASRKTGQFAAGPILVVPVDQAATLGAMNSADKYGIDLTDALLLHTSQAQKAMALATDDGKLAQACEQLGITPENPIDPALRQQITAWEATNLPAKGLPRLLYQIHQWLNRTNPKTAEDFWSQTGQGSHLP
jgi:predicted nucleic acid-binding protein